MFLVQINESDFIDAERIDWISIKKDRVLITLINDTETVYQVADEYLGSFLNNIHALNSNIFSIESFHDNLK